MKKIIVLIALILCMPVVYGGASRTISQWNCPVGYSPGPGKDFVVVTVTQTSPKAQSSWLIYEELLNSWSYSSSTHCIISTSSQQGYKKLICDAPASQNSITYKILIPSNVVGSSCYSSSVTGQYKFDTGARAAITGQTNFEVRPNTCNTANSGNYCSYNGYDDRDSDGAGMGCGCQYPDCDDDPSDDSTQTYPIVDKNAHDLTNAYKYTGYNSNKAAKSAGFREDSISTGYCDGIDNDCGLTPGDCCPTYYNTLHKPAYYDSVSPARVCNGLDNTEKWNFINAWFYGQARPTLQDIIANIPSDYTNS